MRPVWLCIVDLRRHMMRPELRQEGKQDGIWWAHEHMSILSMYEHMRIWVYEHMSIWAHEQCSLSILSIWVYWAYEHIDPMSIRAYEHMSRATYDETRQVEQPATQGRRGAESCCRPSEQQQQQQQQQKQQSATRLSPGQAESHMGKAFSTSGTRHLSCSFSPFSELHIFVHW